MKFIVFSQRVKEREQNEVRERDGHGVYRFISGPVYILLSTTIFIRLERKMLWKMQYSSRRMTVYNDQKQISFIWTLVSMCVCVCGYDKKKCAASLHYNIGLFTFLLSLRWSIRLFEYLMKVLISRSLSLYWPQIVFHLYKIISCVLFSFNFFSWFHKHSLKPLWMLQNRKLLLIDQYRRQMTCMQ